MNSNDSPPSQLGAERVEAGLAALMSLARTPAVAAVPVPRRGPKVRVLGVGVLTGAILGFVIALHMARSADGSEVLRLGWYGSAVVTLISAKLILSLLAAPPRIGSGQAGLLARYKVAGVVTCVNEDPAAFAKCLMSLLHSTRLPDALTVIDDGSESPDCATIARSLAPAFRAAGVDYGVIVFPQNRGKRAGLAAGFRRTWDADVYLCVDSDTILHPEAVANALRPFASRRVQATTGAISPRTAVATSSPG